MDSGQRNEMIVEERLQEALDAAEGQEVCYHIRESMQLLQVDEED